MTAFDSTTATNAELDLKQQEVDASRNTKLVIECAADILPERVEWLWPGRLRHRQAIVDRRRSGPRKISDYDLHGCSGDDRWPLALRRRKRATWQCRVLERRGRRK